MFKEKKENTDRLQICSCLNDTDHMHICIWVIKEYMSQKVKKEKVQHFWFQLWHTESRSPPYKSLTFLQREKAEQTEKSMSILGPIREQKFEYQLQPGETGKSKVTAEIFLPGVEDSGAINW